jgi:hypothetical protein
VRRPLVVAVALLVGLMVTSAVESEAATTPPSGTKVTVSATESWRDSGVRVTKGDTVFYSWVDGTWTVDYRSFPYVGPQGYPPATDSQIYQGCKWLENQPYARLVSSVTGHRTWLGPGGQFAAPSTGPLYLSIHDHADCLGDNAGAVTMRFAVYPMLDRSCEAAQATDRAMCRVALRPHVPSTREEQLERYVAREIANRAWGAGCFFFDVAEQVTPSDSPAKGGVVLVKCVAEEIALSKLLGNLNAAIVSAHDAFVTKVY